MNRDHQMLWELPADEETIVCVMVSCCAGAELQVLRSTAAGEERIILRELYPDRDSLYERARELRLELAASSSERPADEADDIDAAISGSES
jgi:hypothetical protein